VQIEPLDSPPRARTGEVLVPDLVPEVVSPDARARAWSPNEPEDPAPGAARSTQTLVLEPLSQPPAGSGCGPPAVDLGKPENAKQKQVVDRWLPQVLEKFGELNAARKRVMLHPCRPTYTNLALMAKRLDDGHTPDELSDVIRRCEDSIRAGDERGREYFDAISPFRPENFERKLAMPSPLRAGARASPRSLPLSSSLNEQTRELIRSVWK
jgi:hypothetical protein